MSDREQAAEVAQAEPWPLYDKWWLGIRSKPHPEHIGFDVIEISAEGPGEFKKVVASIMVPKIDGLVCESHSFISSLIHQNVAYEAKKTQVLVEALEEIKSMGEDWQAKAMWFEAMQALQAYKGEKEYELVPKKIKAIHDSLKAMDGTPSPHHVLVERGVLDAVIEVCSGWRDETEDDYSHHEEWKNFSNSITKLQKAIEGKK